MNAGKAVELIRQLGIFGLGECDGCACCHFEVQGVSVSISCHKSEHCVRVYSHHMDRDPMALESVAAEVLLQLNSFTSAKEYRVRFCEYSDDHVGGHYCAHNAYTHSFRCCYCHGFRRYGARYLCASCQERPEAMAYYPWSQDGFLDLKPRITEQTVAEVGSLQ